LDATPPEPPAPATHASAGPIALHVPAGLPEPGPEARALVAPLLEVLAGALRAGGGAIPFSRYLEIALYTPGLGYYSGPLEKLGQRGDFVTAPELTPLFGRCVARQCAQVLEAIGGGAILELGPGSGRLAADVLLALEGLGRLPERYLLLEVSAGLRARQAETLARQAPHLQGRVEWLDRLPANRLAGVILANEVADAVPFHRIRRETEGLSELYVTLAGDRLAWRAGPPSDARLLDELAAVEADLGAPLPVGYETEIAPQREAWVQALADSLGQGLVLIADYGFTRREYYHPQRAEGTLICHYRQRAHGDALALPGLQDVTADVDFSALARAASQAGLHVAGFVSQADFLLGTGLLEHVAAAAEGWDRVAASSAAKRLTLPGLMGERFKVLGLTRGLDLPLRGFGVRDRRGRL
jgi:SAM-dependent MidA family methyltransferase